MAQNASDFFSQFETVPAKDGKDYFSQFEVVTDTPQPPVGPSQAESAVRGAAQGVTMGFADELAGVARGIGALGTGGDVTEAYKRGRDESRAAYKAAEQAHSKTYLAGQVGGGVLSMLVPGGIAAKAGIGAAKTVGGLAARAAVEGGIQGLGASERETVAGDIAEAAKGAAIGGLVGGAIGGLSKNLAGREASAVIRDLRPRPTIKRELAKLATQLDDKAEDLVPVIQKAKELVEVRALNLSNKETVEKVLTKHAEIGAGLGEYYKALDTLGNTAASVPEVVGTLSSVAKELRGNAATASGARQVERLIASVKEAYPTGVVGFKELSELVTETQAGGFVGNILEPKLGAKVSREAGAKLRQLLNNGIKKVSPEEADAVLELNKQYSLLSPLARGIKERAVREIGNVQPRTPASLQGVLQSIQDVPWGRKLGEWNMRFGVGRTGLAVGAAEGWGGDVSTQIGSTLGRESME